MAIHADEDSLAKRTTDQMKRGQINRHRIIWLLMGPLMAAIIFGALHVRPSLGVVENDSLPVFLEKEAR